MGSIPGWVTEIPHAMQPSQKKKKKYTKIKIKKVVQLNVRTEKEKIEKSGLLAMAKQRYQQITSKKKKSNKAGQS